MKYYIGLMSGTSLDGVDGVIYNFANNSLIEHSYLPYDSKLQKDITNLAQITTLENIANIELKITNIYLEVINNLLTSANINHKDIIAIGVHGQTIYHDSGVYSKQLGLGAKIAYQTKITTINDFRTADIIAGGQGAPLTPKYHQYLLDNNNGIVVNLGGIANITQIKNNKIIGFDSGPANTLIDNYMLKHFNINYDKDGLKARSGFIIENLLNIMLGDEYFNKLAPKSTGVEYFNLNWLDNFLNGNERPQDVIRTLTELTAITITNHLTRGKIYFCGGGVFNNFLMERIEILAPNCQILTTNNLGINPQFIEAIAFAYFAKLRMENKPANIPSVSGAKQEVILGTKYYG